MPKTGKTAAPLHSTQAPAPAMAANPPVHSTTPASTPLIFALNGSKVELHSVHPSITLLSFIRSHTRFTGTKLSCGEGGCGACVVLLSKYDVNSKEVEEFVISSCLTLLCSIDRCAITTTEGLGSTQNGFHAVHKRLAGFHGSQCGFCSPGMCMSIYSSLRRAQRQQLRNQDENSSESHDTQYTLPQLSSIDAQKAIAGHICRCTGYRPILDACRSFAGDVDLEDLGINAFWSHTSQAEARLLPAYSPSLDPKFPKFLIDELEASYIRGPTENGNIVRLVRLDINHRDHIWLTPNTLEGVFDALQVHQPKRKVKLVVGNTSAGIYKDARPEVFIDISHIPELLILRDTDAGLEVGAAVTIQKLIDMLEAKLNAAISHAVTNDGSVYSGILGHLKRVANAHVRNSASVGGNLIMAQQFSFDSDIATIFLGAGVSLYLVTNSRKLIKLSMEEFLRKGSLDLGILLQSIVIPSWPDVDSGQIEKMSITGQNGDVSEDKVKLSANGKDNPFTKRLFKTYRAAPRKLGNAVAYVNAAFFAELEYDGDGHYMIKRVRLAFGAFGQKHAIRAQDLEKFLLEKVIGPGTLLNAIEILKAKYVVPSPGTRKAEYRISVATGFLFKFFCPFLQERPVKFVQNGDKPDCKTELPFKASDQQNPTNVPSSKISGANETFEHSEGSNEFAPISGKQKVNLYEKYYPVGQPTAKVGAEIQAAGEAIYVDDIPAPDNCLFAAFVYSEEAFATINHIETKLALASPGVVAYISADDIPEGGKNLGVQTFLGSENLFASNVVECVGHPIGVVVADTPEHARCGAKKVKVVYGAEYLPVLSIEDAVEKNSFFPIPPQFLPEQIGDAAKEFSEAEHTIECAEVRTGSQYFFYMENQTALAIPDEDDCLVVYSSCQGTELVQQCISTCLGVPFHSIRIITRRVGGGFGGKFTRSITVAAACAVAANKLRRPVRMYLDRNTDMIMMGGRHPTKTIYSVGFTSTGKVTSLQVKVFIEAGWSPDISPCLPTLIMSGLKKYNWGTVEAEFKVCKTNLSSKSAMRAPGHVQGSFIADTVIEHIAATLGLDVHKVIETNMHTLESAAVFFRGTDAGGDEGYTLPSIWNVLKESIRQRQKAVKSFNQNNMWLKRGLAITQCVYEVTQTNMPARVSIFLDGSIVVEVGGVELGQGLWTKVKQAAIFGLSQLWQDGKGMDLMNVRVVQADSISLPNGGYTNNSTTSEGNCEAVRQACKILVDRLLPTKMKLEAQHPGGVDWSTLIKMAKFAQVDLSAQIQWFPHKDAMSYLNYGAAASEVQVDVLTGETIILQTDLIYDCGKSLNPAVDIGQIEGSFVQGIGFFVIEEHVVDCNGRVVSDGTWSYKPPTIDNIPRNFNVEILNGPIHHNRILSSKACGEPPLLLAGSVHAAIRRAIEAAKHDTCNLATGDKGDKGGFFRLDVPLSFDRIKDLYSLEGVEQHLRSLIKEHSCKSFDTRVPS